MKPGELTRVEDTLRRAYGDALAAVERDDTSPELLLAMPPGRPPRGAGRPGGRRRWVVPAAAGAAVAVVALVAGLLVPTEVQHPPSPPAPRPASGGSMMAYVAGWRSFRGPNSVVPVDLATGRALTPIGLGVRDPVGDLEVTPNGRTAYVVTEGGDVVPIDLATRRAEPPIRIGGDLSEMLISPNGRTGFVLDYPNGVATINLVTNRRGRFIKIHNAAEMALLPNRKIFYVGTAHGQEVFPVDTATLRTLPPIMTSDYNDVLSARIVAAPDGRTAYLLSGKPGIPGQVLTPIDTAAGTVLPSIVVSASALGAAPTISPDGRSAYLDTGYGVMAVDLTTGKIRWTVNLGGPDVAYQVAVSPDSQTVYMTGNGYYIEPIDAANGTQLTPILEGWLATEIAFGPDGKLYLLAIRVTKPPEPAPSWALTRFDPATGAVGRPISLPSGKSSSWGDLTFGG